MRHFLLRHHQQKKIFLKRNMYIKDIERTHLISCKFFKNKLAKLMSSGMEKIAQNPFLMPATLRYRRRDY